MLNFGFVENYREAKMIIYPQAKINIGLYVTEKRTDGFHNISTCFFPLKLSDILEYQISEEEGNNLDQIIITGNNIPGNPSDNLVIKACQHLRSSNNLPYFKIHLHKIIPLGAGLGGGSSDCAAILKEIQKFANPLPSPSDIKKIALSLGSDCPFFLKPESSLAFGRGEDLRRIDVNLKGYWISVFNPGIHISTKKAYQMVKIGIPDSPLEESLREPIDNWKSLIHNAFEAPVFALHPEIQNLKEALYKAGAVYASMSGSGSSVFGIFREKISWNGDLANAHIWTESL